MCILGKIGYKNVHEKLIEIRIDSLQSQVDGPMFLLTTRQLSVLLIWIDEWMVGWSPFVTQYKAPFCVLMGSLVPYRLWFYGTCRYKAIVVVMQNLEALDWLSLEICDNMPINRPLIRSNAGKKWEQRTVVSTKTDCWSIAILKRREGKKERLLCYALEMKYFFPLLLMLIKCLILILFIIINSSNGPKYLNELKWKDLKGDWRLFKSCKSNLQRLKKLWWPNLYGEWGGGEQ